MHIGTRSIPVEYYILRVREPGTDNGDRTVVGFLADRPIFDTIMDSSGELYHYVGIAVRLADGRYDVESLAFGEWIVEPGLIYRNQNCTQRYGRDTTH